jgi:hypothetical protein
MTKQIDTMSGAWPFHAKSNWYYIWGLIISWQNTLMPCLELDHFMTKQTDTMSGAWPFHAKTNWYYVWGLIISWQNTLMPCLGLAHFMTKETDTNFIMILLSIYIYIIGLGTRFNNLLIPLHDWYYVWGYVWGLTISWQNRQILCLGLDHFMTKQIDAISGAWPFQDKTDRYYIWGFTISWQNRLTLYLGLDQFVTKQTDTIYGAW